MTTNQIIGLVVAVIVLLIVIALVTQAGRRRKAAADRDKANELREEADRTRLRASEQLSSTPTATVAVTAAAGVHATAATVAVTAA